MTPQAPDPIEPDGRASEAVAERISKLATLRSEGGKWRLGSQSEIVFLIFAPVFFGFIYISVQWLQYGSSRDTWFVAILCGATALLVQGVLSVFSFISHRAPGYFAYCRPNGAEEEWTESARKLVGSIFDRRAMLVSGLVYGAAIGLAPLVLGVWWDDPILLFLLGLFMASVNFVTGVGFYALLKFFFEIWKMRDEIQVSLWSRENPSTNFLDDVRSRAALLASLYVAICLSSVLFSLLPSDGLIVAYSVFSATVILAAYSVPGALIRARMSDRKRAALAAIDGRLDQEFRDAVKLARERNATIDLEGLDQLLALRDRIDKRLVWPVGWRSIRTGLSVVAVTALPIVLERVLLSL